MGFSCNFVIKVAWKRIGKLQKIKYQISREALSILHLTFIRPISGYSCAVWDSYSKELNNWFERLQLYAARIITGLPIYTNKEYLYYETGWEKLVDRRKIAGLKVMDKIHQGNVSDFLIDITPPLVGNIIPYSTRNTSNYVITACRLEVTKSSFLQPTFRDRNPVSTKVTQSPTLNIFQSHLGKMR